MYNQKELTELFQKLGAPNPELWAASQTEAGINQLGRFLFMRQMWSLVLDENDHSWIQTEIEHSKRNPGAPCSGIGPALQRLLDKGAAPQDITDVVRVMQYVLLFRVGYLLDDPNLSEPELQDFFWGLFQVNEDGEIIDPIEGLYSSLLSLDPTGREMRPRKSNT
jgi:hypothetical protein